MAPNTFRKLQGKHVLVLGGSSGIGFGVAEGALAEGAAVTISSSNPARVEKAVDKLKALYGADATVQGLACDLDTKDCEARLEDLFRTATASSPAYGPAVHHVVITAGRVTGMASLKTATTENIMDGAHLRMGVPILVAKVALGYLPKDTGSSLTLTTGASADRPIPGWTATNYHIGGLITLTRSLAVDMAPIRVNIVKPGMVHTELWSGMPADEQNALLDIAKKLPVGSVGSAVDVAEAYLWLMKDRFVTGTIASSDGGALIQ